MYNMGSLTIGAAIGAHKASALNKRAWPTKPKWLETIIKQKLS
jgi:hypothetical protein